MIALPQHAQFVLDTLAKAGFEGFAVGGSVRDGLMGKTTKGWDFTTNATPEDILKLFPDSFYDNQFGTVGIKIKSKENETIDVYEITPYRSESGYSDHRHPDKIAWGKTIEDDLKRRDFTINAIAFNGKKLIDPHAGQTDITNKIIRAVGDPSVRFTEDALRMMRAVRIASQLGFMIDEQTRAAIEANAQLLTKISSERVRDELMKILASPFAADGILLLKATGLLHYILPELEDAFPVGQKSPNRHHIYDVGTHSVEALRHCPSTDPVVRLATLLHDIGKPKTVKTDETGVVTFYNHEVIGAKMAKLIAVRLKLSKKDINRIYLLTRWHQFTVDERQTDTALRRFIRHVEKENLEDMLALRIGDRLGGGAKETSWRLELFKKRLEEVQKQPFGISDLKVSGHDVMKTLNVAPGPIVGKILNDLFALVEKQEIANERDALLAKIRELGKQH